MTEPRKFVIFTLQFTDGKIDVPLSYPQRMYLLYLRRVQEADIDYSKLALDQQEAIRELVWKWRFISESDALGYSFKRHRLSDTGKNVAEEIARHETTSDVDKEMKS